MENVICEICKKKFKRKRSQILLAKKHYCSVICQTIGRRKGKIIECYICGRKVYKKNRDINNSKNNKYFCGVRCSNKWFGSINRGNNHSNWINGKSSYKDILKREGKLRICSFCGESDARVLAVHHIDQNRNNNSITNLSWLCHNCHFLIHNYSDELIEFDNKLNK